ncbi:hypothetical protein Nepgr_011817 [Nepenthes gracilis]|uniref:Uncharacterized protein n=1 Tax=Nepenthes gracilis TaxID=150966 RepID=A0AAD3XMP9_NEPGR|nr:hypothetical protein Nepgr_011817 [Nepenthes gracilis]
MFCGAAGVPTAPGSGGCPGEDPIISREALALSREALRISEARHGILARGRIQIFGGGIEDLGANYGDGFAAAIQGAGRHPSCFAVDDADPAHPISISLCWICVRSLAPYPLGACLVFGQAVSTSLWCESSGPRPRVTRGL